MIDDHENRRLGSVPLDRRDLLKGGVAVSLAAGAITAPSAAAAQDDDDDELGKVFPPFENAFVLNALSMRHPIFYALPDGVNDPFDKTGQPLQKPYAPIVILMHELPGMTPHFWRLAHWINQAGYIVLCPDLYGDGDQCAPTPSSKSALTRICISREFHVMAKNKSSPITDWLRQLARLAFDKNGGIDATTGIGVIGLCLTGNFALSMVMEDCVIAPIASEPAMPFDMLTKCGKAALHMSDDEKAALKNRKNVDVMGLRFDGDPSCTKYRFDAIENIIGKDRFNRIELPNHAKNPNGNPFPHAVLTKDLIDEKGSLTIQARDQMITFLEERLKVSS